jgi:hypothetical protein
MRAITKRNTVDPLCYLRPLSSPSADGYPDSAGEYKFRQPLVRRYGSCNGMALKQTSVNSFGSDMASRLTDRDINLRFIQPDGRHSDGR